MRLTTEYALAARVLAQDVRDPVRRREAQAKGRALPRLEDSEFGFLKARCASFIKSLLINIASVPDEGLDQSGGLLTASANFLLMLPDEPASRAPATRGPQRYVPGRDG